VTSNRVPSKSNSGLGKPRAGRYRRKKAGMPLGRWAVAVDCWAGPLLAAPLVVTGGRWMWVLVLVLGTRHHPCLYPPLADADGHCCCCRCHAGAAAHAAAGSSSEQTADRGSG
jgi:hypothetical protein